MVRAYEDAEWDGGDPDAAFRDALKSVLPGLTVERLAALLREGEIAVGGVHPLEDQDTFDARAVWLLGRLQGDPK